MNDYLFKNDKISAFQFYKLPHALINNEDFKCLSNDAKLLYPLLLDRTSLLIKNHWFDSGGKVYINYPLTEVVEKLNIGLSKACKLMKELESIGLIERKRIGLGKPDIIYVKTFYNNNKPDYDNSNIQNEGIEQSVMLDNTDSESSNKEHLHYNYKTDETIPSKSDQSNQSDRNAVKNYLMNREYYLSVVKRTLNMNGSYQHMNYLIIILKYLMEQLRALTIY